jgi:hypothetical protein
MFATDDELSTAGVSERFIATSSENTNYFWFSFFGTTTTTRRLCVGLAQ